MLHDPTNVKAHDPGLWQALAILASLPMMLAGHALTPLSDLIPGLADVGIASFLFRLASV
jgi:hypothetical protein